MEPISTEKLVGDFLAYKKLAVSKISVANHLKSVFGSTISEEEIPGALTCIRKYIKANRVPISKRAPQCPRCATPMVDVYLSNSRTVIYCPNDHVTIPLIN
jgi:hypothetical protein